MTASTLVLGVGNTLRGDEGAGVHAMRALQDALPPTLDVGFIDGGTLSFTLSTYIAEEVNLIVLDAAELHQAPGTVHTLIGEEMDAFLGAVKRSPHEVGLLDLMDIARLTGTLPRNRALIGIQPETLDWSMEPSRPVQAGIGQAVEAARALIEQWHAAAGETPHPTPRSQPMKSLEQRP